MRTLDAYALRGAPPPSRPYRGFTYRDATRIMGWVDRSGECWEWTGVKDAKGYGRVSVGNLYRSAHRAMYELLVGPIPTGLTIDHLCRNRGCVNPAHMEPVTNRENVLRGFGVTAAHARQTHCYRGHEFTPENTRRVVNNGVVSRGCYACKREYERARKAAKRAVV